MELYLKGFITGSVFMGSFFIFIGSNSPQVIAIENEIIKIWEQEKQHDILIKDNRAKISNLEEDIDIHSKSINLHIKSLTKDFDKLINQLNEHCECYRNQIFLHRKFTYEIIYKTYIPLSMDISVFLNSF